VAEQYREVRIDTSFAAWAHKIMENRLLGYIQRRRREKGRSVSSDSEEFLPGTWVPDPTLRMKLLVCLKKLGLANRRYARIINLHHFGLSRKEVCEKMNMNPGQSYVVMSRARAMLKECLDKGNLD
jgi:DNA-directed RNA polymerase specialized sigma24 family protein